ncbi:head-tail connector protein [Vagococcus entomophilus]|uniref:Phage gp6-like head-tail connector protein n=1 Tax=Vagococcus entomophilus TaxID=1160095 RepID=A0A430AK04_9ENTE|nr:head-tail connector protein [Vagococcus entomophilus]RSU08436.1 hypothetical protein CBF30_04135 [Vagococcus entomophilus]
MVDLLADLKKRMHIFHNSEDDNLQRILNESQAYVKDKTGFDESNERAKTLVLERARYAYNDSLEFFEDNFLGELLGLSITQLKGDSEDGET